jgi:hypothetical protein
MDDFERDEKGTSVAFSMISIMTTQQDRLLFRTADGRLGHAKGSFAAGDQLVLFDGALVPYLIRKCQGEPRELYELVGIAYLRGAMHGEIDSWGLESQDIVLV